MKMSVVVLGLSITSSWGNGHASTYRALLRALSRRGHNVLFLERDQPWYADNRDLPNPPFCTTLLYDDFDDLRRRFAGPVKAADLVIVGSYVPDGVAVGEWVMETASGVTAFYDIDTPVTLAQLRNGDCTYLSRALTAAYDLYLSFTGGRVLETLQREFGAARARPLYCSVDPTRYHPRKVEVQWEVGYMGTYSADRQPKLEGLLLEPARGFPRRRFAVAGPQYPASVLWPDNVDRFEHLQPDYHPAFYGSQRFTLNITRADMVRLGWSPSVRLFEAAACGTAIISDCWEGLETFLRPGEEIFLARSGADLAAILSGISEAERQRTAAAARERVFIPHTATEWAWRLEAYVAEVGSAAWRLGRAAAVSAEAG